MNNFDAYGSTNFGIVKMAYTSSFSKKKEKIFILFINLLHGNFMADMT